MTQLTRWRSGPAIGMGHVRSVNILNFMTFRGDIRKAHELNVCKRETHLFEVKCCENTRPGHQLQASRKQHEILSKRWRLRKLSFTPSFLVWEALSIPLVLKIIWKSSALINNKPVWMFLNYMIILCFMHTYWQQLDALLKKPVALKALVWSRGQLVTLQIFTSSSFSLVEETHGSSDQCVSFSLIDVGSGLTAFSRDTSFLL